MIEKHPLPIPAAFYLHGTRVSVEFQKDLILKGWIGQAQYTTNTLALQTNTEHHLVLPEQMEKVYCHELIHWILREMDERELNDNEKFVEQFAGLLHQSLTMYEKRKDSDAANSPAA